MRSRFSLWGAVLFGAMVSAAMAQQTTAAQPAAPEAPVFSTPAAPAEQAPEGEWVPDGVAALGRRANSRVGFRLDHSMLALASKIDGNNPELRRAIAGLDGISVQSFHFAQGVLPDATAMESVARQYEEAGWLHVMSKHGHATGRTDMWLRVEALAVREFAVLLVRPREVDFISASGRLSPLELMHLGGRFGIPKMDQPMAPPAPSDKAEEGTDPR